MIYAYGGEQQDQSVKITFISMSIEQEVWLTRNWTTYKDHIKAERGYKLVVFQITAENKGVRKATKSRRNRANRKMGWASNKN